MPRVSRPTVDKQLDEIETLIREHPEGIGRLALGVIYTDRYGRKIPERTLQRRLEQLVTQGRGLIEKESTNTIYRPGPGIGGPHSAAIVSQPRGQDIGTGVHKPTPAEENQIPLSQEGREINTLIRRSLTERGPVGYNRAFLENYIPGTTWYLPKSVREQLHKLGQTPDANREAGTYAREMLGRLLIDLAWASSRLEGNTYSRLDTQNLIEFGQRAEGKDATETQMILNHKNAIELLVADAEELAFDRRTLFTLHGALSDNLLLDAGDEGRLRTRMVYITGTRYTPIAIPQVIEECFDLLLAKAAAIPDPFEQSFFGMVHIPYLQPFVDINKRTSRLAANIPLIVANLCPLSFVDVPEQIYVDGTLGIYELTRVELLRDVFVWAYERSCIQYRIVRDAIGQPDPVRLRYRNELATLVRETVLAGDAPRTEALRVWAQNHRIPAADLEGFVERALSLLVNLHEGTAGRYRLRPSEFYTWKARFTRH